MTERILKLEKKKELLQEKLHQLHISYIKDEITKEEYVDKKFNILNGRFEEDVFHGIEEEINKLSARKKTKTIMLAALIILGAMLPLLHYSGITAFATFDQQQLSTFTMNQTYTTNKITDMSFINTTQARVSGKIYGHGQTWIYLVSDGQRRLIHYADTRQTGITGMATGIPANNINAQSAPGQNKTLNKADNQTNNNTTTNQTTNSTQSKTTNTSINNTRINQTIKQTTNTTTNQTINQTDNTENETIQTNASTYTPEIITDKESYEIGENISIQVLPENSTYSLYLFAPDDTYLLQENWWTAQVSGNHTISGFVTYQNNTERASKTITVTKPETSTFTQACIETCDMAEKQNLIIEIVVNNTEIKLDNITYLSEPEIRENNTNQTTQTTSTNSSSTLGVASGREAGARTTPSPQRKCLLPNPNARPKECFTEKELQEKFPDKKFRLINELGKTMAVFDGQGNLILEGQVNQNAQGNPSQYDFMVRGNNQAASWIDAVSKDLNLRGNLYENQETLTWESRRDYVVSNEKGMYLGVFRADGNVYIRGEVMQG